MIAIPNPNNQGSYISHEAEEARRCRSILSQTASQQFVEG